MRSFTGRTYSIRRQIQIGRKQSKNRMVGQTFNPSGITSEQIDARERTYVADWQAKGEDAIQAERARINEMREGWPCSWPWEWCAFERNFGLSR